jgi:hypothetical protein
MGVTAFLGSAQIDEKYIHSDLGKKLVCNHSQSSKKLLMNLFAIVTK